MRKLPLLLILCSVCFGVSPTITNFNTGQVSLLLEARTDFQKYNSSSRTIENMLVATQGPVFRRPGTKYIASQKTASAAGRVIAYEHSVDDSYILLFENQVLQFFRDGGQILDGAGTEDISGLDNIIAHWLLNDDVANTTVLDDDGATHDGTASANTSTLNATGKVGTGCFNLDGTYAVSVTDHADFTFVEGTDGDFSITSWILVTRTGVEQIILSKWDETTGSQIREWKFLLDSSQKLQLCIADESLLLDSDLIAQWKMNDNAASSTVTDTCGSNNGALSDGDSDYTSDHSVTGKVSNALDLDGTDDCILVADDAVFSFGDGAVTDSPFSISAWVNMDDATSFDILSKRDADSAEWYFRFETADKLTLILFDAVAGQSISQIADVASTASQGSWIHVVATYDATEANTGITLYINGSVWASTGADLGAYGAMHNTADDVYIGRSVADAKYANGKIDNVMIFGKELSQAEVTALYNSASGVESLGAVYPSTITDDALDTGWRYVAMTYEGNHASWTGATAANYITMYVDGAAVDVTATNLSTYSKMEDTDAVPRIGAQESTAGVIEKIFADKLDEVAVFNDKLSAAEVASLYDATGVYELTTPYLTADLFGLDFKKSEDVMYITHPDYEPRQLSRAGHALWTIETLGINDGPFREQNTDTTFTITPSATTGSITLTASSYLFDSDHIGALWQINQKRTSSVLQGALSGNGSSSSTDYFVGSYAFATTGTWDGTITLERSTDAGANWSAALTALSDINFDNPAEEEEDGAIYRVTMSGYTSGTCNYTLTITDQYNHGIVKITGVSSGTVATVTVLTDLVSTDATSRWREGYWSDYRGWPETVTVHQQRLIFGGSESFPQTIWFGKADPDDYTNFTEGTLDTSAFTIALSGQNPIQWLLPQDYLLIGTSGSCGKYGEQGGAVTPTSPNYQEQTRHGSASIRAVLAGDTVLYIERGAREVREFSYDLQFDKYLSPPLTILSPEITDSGIKDVAFQLRPNPILWCVLNNGDIATLTYQREQSVIAWTEQITDGDFESIAIISGTDEDEVWVSVERTVNSNTARYVEQFQPVDWGSDINDCWFVDSGLTYTGTATTGFGGIDHLIGETVSIYADTLIESNEVVDVNGEIVIDNAAARVLAGLPFTSKLETLPLRIDPQDKIANKKIKRIGFDLYETGHLQYGNGANSELTNTNSFFKNDLEADPNATRQGLYTSTDKPKVCNWFYGSRVKQTVYVETSQPVPLTIRSITTEFDLYP